MNTNDSDQVIDLLVLGAGMAGLSAATRALQGGASVIVAEKGPAAGGTAQYAGFIWTAPSVEVMREVNPHAVPELAEKVALDYPQAMAWVRSLGIDAQPPVTLLGYGRGCQTDIAGYLATCQRYIRERGELLVSTRAERLLVEDGAVRGAVLVDANGVERTVRARHTLLATGGFGGDPELRAQLIHPNARDIPLRANPYSRGDGLKLGQAAGAAIGLPDAGFYGHLIPSQIPYDNPLEFVTLSFFQSEHSVLVNLDGERFCDETLGDHLTTMAVLEQREGRALMLYDQRVHDDWLMRPYVEGTPAIDRFALAYKRGARAAVAERIEDFAELPEEWGYDGAKVLAALQAYNAGCAAGTHSPGRKRDADPLVKAPFYVAEVIPAITFTFTGLRIDTAARVQDGNGNAIPGLLAAGADSGGVYNRAYAGGLANALVFGLQAAATTLAARG